MLERIMLSRAAIFVANIVMFFVLYLVNRDYASVDFWIYGYIFSDFSFSDFIVLVGLMALGAICLPRRIDRPSSLFLIVTYWFIIVPLQVLGLTGAPVEYSDRYDLLFVVHIGFFVCAMMNQRRNATVPSRVAHPMLMPVLIGLWTSSAILLVLKFGDVMRISSADLIYEQREIGRARNFLDGYLQTYSQYVFSTALVAFGCYRKNVLLVLAGLAGALLNYAITAEKSSVAYPFFIIALFFMLKSKSKLFVTSSFVSLALSTLCFIGLLVKSISSVGVFLTWYVGVRTLLTPGQQIILYYDYFTERGFTYFSHIRGLNLIIPIPDAYVNESRWPSLGHIIGDLHLNLPGLNSNANFIATDGYAGLGFLGVVFVFVLVGALVKMMDKVANGIDMKLLLPILLPIALTLTNGSIFTVLTSFGGFFWAIVFAKYFKKDPQDVRAA